MFVTEECRDISKNISYKYLAKFLRSIAGLKSKKRKLQDLLVTCLYFFWDINYYVSLNSFTHLESVMNPLLVVQLTCQQL